MAKKVEKKVVEERNQRKTRIGVVSSNKMDKTITVKVHTKVKHPIYKKTMNHTTTLVAHDEKMIRGVEHKETRKRAVGGNPL